ncbi:MAG: CHAT domain-containing protein [Nitrospiraceae bacterium]
MLLCASALALALLLGYSHSAAVPAESPEQLFQRGAFEEAAQQWQALAESHAQAKRPLERSDALVGLAQAYLSLGHYTKAAQQLELALALLHPLNDRVREATVLGALGHVYLAAGQRDAALSYLTDGLSLARELNDPARTAVLLNNLGTLHAWQQQDEEALKQFTESRALADTAKLPLVAVQAMLNAGKSSLRLGRVPEARSWMDQAARHLRPLPPSHEKAYGLITLGMGYADLGARLAGERDRLLVRAASVLEEAGEVGKAIGDKRATSYAFGFRGRLYEQARRVEDALLLTRLAVADAQQVNASESLYRWEWQTGRLLKQQGKLKDAVAAYQRAVEIIKTIRPELTAGGGGLGGSFRESAGSVFVELADLYLRLTDKTNSYLVEARDAIELSKAAELRDYFHDDCVDLLRSRMTSLEQVSKTTAVIYPILLPDRTELLVSLPDGLRRVTVPVGVERLTQEVRQFRRFLEKRTTQQYLRPARQLYDWLIRPLEPSLKAFPLDTLVIVPDGPLRTIPMAALHDGKDFLIRKYAIATTPGLTLTDARPLRRDDAKVLAAGLTVAVQGFSALPYVESELSEIEKLYGSRMLVNDAFRSSALEQELRETQFAVVHVASHAKFESRAADTFLLTFDDKVTMDQLNELIGVFRFRDDPLELLTLSACETAAGDDRAALGLAGVAIKAGARSALATLWYISDVATSELVGEFYRQLRKPTLSKAMALQRAQLMMLDDPVGRHPGYWAPFLLIGNWL